MKALAVFHDGIGTRRHWLAPLLKPGFRHVFCALQSGDYWIVIDGRMGVPEIEVVAGTEYDLAGFYRRQGFLVLEVEQGDRPVHAPLVHNNCVGLVKTALCIRSYALTPWQLYRHLERTCHATDSGVQRERAEAEGGSAAAPADAHSGA